MKPRNYVALAMLKAPKRGSLVHKDKRTTQVGHHRRGIAMETEDWCMEDVPCYEITVKIAVTGHNVERAQEFLENFFRRSKRVEECDIWSWDFVDWEQA